MNNLEGKKWIELTIEEKETLMSCANAVDAESGLAPKKSCECIVDFGEYELSIVGRVIINDDFDEITIDDNAVLYNPAR